MLVNKNTPCLIIAEIGLNHNGDYQLAYDSVLAAAEAGASAVKFQNFVTEDFLTDKSILHTYKNGDTEITEPLYDICKRSEFKSEWIKPIKQLCDELDIIFTSTPTSEQGVDDLVLNGIKIIKNGSDYLTHIPLLKYMASKGETIIISTGMAYQEDIDNAVNAVQDFLSPGGQLIILHCTSSYPTTPINVNLCKMGVLKERYNVTVGFSDHTEGWIAAVQAVTLGAKIIEKHFTLDKSLPGPDHWFSSNPEEFLELVNQVRFAEVRMGFGDLKPAESEMDVREEWRLGLVWDRELTRGDFVARNDIAVRKPSNGFLPKDIDIIIGKKLSRNCVKGESVVMDDFSN